MASPTAAERRFLEWLEAHGAAFPKVQWPATTPAGLRGATARTSIAPLEPMVCVPRRLMISEETCWADAELRRVYEENRDVFSRDDPVIALFLVRELAKGDESFFSPYLSILPEVETVQDWSPAELAQLRDPALVEAAARRVMEVKAFYSKIMRRLEDKYPGCFPSAEYTFERFRFAWKSIQARSFGRRLPWTSLVPFADCLNHANVATKYDFDVDGNGTFRLFPSGSTSYEPGGEVFNSYGRRSNFHLLLDYGFALEDNEWDYVDIELPRDTAKTIGRRFPFRKRVRVERQTTLEALFPRTIFPHEAQPNSADALSGEATGELSSRHDVLRWFRALVIDAMEQFEETLDEAEVQLVDDRLTERQRMAVVYRVGRLRILNRLRQELDEDLSDVCGLTVAVGEVKIDR